MVRLLPLPNRVVLNDQPVDERTDPDDVLLDRLILALKRDTDAARERLREALTWRSGTVDDQPKQPPIPPSPALRARWWDKYPGVSVMK